MRKIDLMRLAGSCGSRRPVQARSVKRPGFRRETVKGAARVFARNHLARSRVDSRHDSASAKIVKGRRELTGKIVTLKIRVFAHAIRKLAEEHRPSVQVREDSRWERTCARKIGPFGSGFRGRGC